MKLRTRFREQTLSLGLALFNCLQAYCVLFFVRHLLLRMVGIRVAPGAVVHRRVTFTSFGKCTIGAGSLICHDVYLDNRKGVQIGCNAMIAQGVKIFSLGHDIHDAGFAAKGAPVHIGDYVCLFTDTKVMPGVKIGRSAVAYPGAVITKDVAEGAVVAGVPARRVNTRQVEQDYRLDYRIWFGR